MCSHQKHMGALHVLLSQTGFPRSLLSLGVCRISLVVWASLCAFSLLKRKRISETSIFLLLPPPGNFLTALYCQDTQISLFSNRFRSTDAFQSSRWMWRSLPLSLRGGMIGAQADSLVIRFCNKLSFTIYIRCFYQALDWGDTDHRQTNQPSLTDLPVLLAEKCRLFPEFKLTKAGWCWSISKYLFIYLTILDVIILHEVLGNWWSSLFPKIFWSHAVNFVALKRPRFEN